MDGAATGFVEGGPVADLGNLERWWNNPGIAAWSFVLFGCFLLNATLLLAFLVRPGLRTISNRFVMNLTASNLLTCAVLNPLLMMDGPSSSTGTTLTTSAASSATAGNVCVISEGATALVTTSSVLSVLLIAVDQYFAVVDPLRYRARVDKLKSAVLIVSVWMISVTFGLVASLNPSPRSLWLSCTVFNDSSFQDAALNTSAVASIDHHVTTLALVFGNESDERVAPTPPAALLKTIESIKIDRSVGLLENSTVIFRTLTNDSVTYGLIYAAVHSVFAYLLPFAGVFWIYISIYSAAHRNSERTRRTGSRPVLSSAASFCEEPYGYTKPQSQPVEIFTEEFRRIPKISSLSSIDETSETTHSANQTSRRRSFSSASDAAPLGPAEHEKTSSAILFTVGLQPVEVSSLREDDHEDDRANRDPVAILKTQYLENEGADSSYEDSVSSEFRDSAADRRESSHDLMYEAVSADEPSRWMSEDSNDSVDSDENDRHYEDCFDYLAVVPRTRSSDYFLSFAGCKTKAKETCGEIVPSNETDARQVSPERTIVGVNDDEENSTVKTSGYAAMEREIQNRGDSANGGNLENRRPRRSSRRSSKAGILDGEAAGKDAENSVGQRNNSAEPSSCLLAPIVTITLAPSKPECLNRVSSIRSTSSYINSLKHRISNGSLFRYREETRAARIGALVIVMGLICWSPYVLLNVIKNLPQYSDYEFPHEYDVLALSFLILAAYVSPLLFGYRSRRVKRELRRFFCFRRELSYKNNRSLMAKKVLKRRHSSTPSHLEMDHRYNIFNCVYGRSRWPKEKVQFVQVPDSALAVETCRSSFSSGASTQISSTSTEEC